MNILKPISLLFIIMLFCRCTDNPVPEKREITNPLFVFNNSLNKVGVDTLPLTQQATLLKKLGYDGLEERETTFLLDAIKVMKGEGLKVFTDYLQINIDSETPYNLSWNEVIPKLKGTGIILWVHVHSKEYEPSDIAADEKIVSVIQQLADFAGTYGVRIAIYHHVDFLVETAGDSYRIASKVNRDNVGSVLNLCHYLRTESEENIENVLNMTLPKLYAVSINGADGGDTQQMGWDRLIRPLGEGSFNVYRFVEMLADKGYKGPVGIQCYSLKEEPEVYLTKTINAWKQFKEQYAAPLNSLTPEEKKEDWELLFDGESTQKWRGINKDHFPEAGWRVEDNSLIADVVGGGESSKAGDIITKEKYDKFILKWEWNMKTKGGNSGVKYYVQEGIGNNKGYGYGLEYQLLDDKYHEWMLAGKMQPNDYHTLGSLYELYPASPDKYCNPLGLWNESMIVSNGSQVEHWLNGKMILKYDRTSEDFKERIGASKFKDVSDFGVVDEGHILLQDHGSVIHYRNIKIRRLK